MKKGITTKSYFLSFNIIYSAQIFALVSFSAVVLFLHLTNQVAVPEGRMDIFQYIVPVLLVAGLTGSYVTFKLFLSKINPALTLKEKLSKYQVLVLTRSAFLEVPGLFACIAALLTGQLYFLVATVMIVVVFILLRPTPFSISEDLKLSPDERSLLENPEAVVYEAEVG